MTSARVARGMKMKDLAEATEISRQMISNYESGKTVPKAENLLKIISVLEFPKGFFQEDTHLLNNGATYFRCQSSATKKIRDMQKERLIYAKMVYDRLALYVNFPVVKLPSLLDKEIKEIMEEDIEKKAQETRSLWGVDSISPIDNLMVLAESCGIIVVEANMADNKLDAVSRWIMDRPFIMLTDNGESAVRRRFNIAHELGHIILHNSVESIHDYSAVELKKMEQQANMFAAHLLLPNEAFISTLLSTSLEFYVDLKRYWKVSIQAMIYKTHNLGFINDDQKLYLNKKIAWNKWKKKEPLDEELPLERPILFKRVYQMILDNNVLSRNELNTLFNLPFDELEKMLNTAISLEVEKMDIRPHLRLLKEI